MASYLKGWQINSIVNLQTPQPWTVSDSTFNFSGSGESADRWDFFGNPERLQVRPAFHSLLLGLQRDC